MRRQYAFDLVERYIVFSPSETIWVHARSASIGTRAVIDGCLRRQRRQNRRDRPKQRRRASRAGPEQSRAHVHRTRSRWHNCPRSRPASRSRNRYVQVRQAGNEAVLAIGLDLVDEPRCGRLRGFGRNVKPDFGEVGFGCVGQAEGERSDSSFLPRAMILSASKSFTRPAATSANPLSISILSAASSSI